MPTNILDVEAGSKAPDFSLNGSQGPFSFSSAIENSALLLYFIREFGCHTCVSHVSRLVAIHDELREVGIGAVVVGGGSLAAAQKLAERFQAPFPILADEDRTVYEMYNLPKAALLFQRSGSFLVAQNGEIVYANRSTAPSGGLDIEAVMQAAKALSADS